MNVIKIQIRCKTCGKLHMEIEVEGRVKYDFKCKRWIGYNKLDNKNKVM